MTKLRILGGVSLVIALACGGLGPDEQGAEDPGGSGVPSDLQGDWYAADGRRLAVDADALGDWRGAGIDGAYVDGQFLFEAVPFEGRGAAGDCAGSLRLVDGGLTVALTGPCSDLNGRWSRSVDGPATEAPKAAAKKASPGKQQAAKAAAPAADIDWCERYVDCVCDVAIAIRHRGGDDSYMISCDTARVLADVGTSDSDCREGLQGMGSWFDGIEAVYPRVVVPKHCR